MNHTLKTAEDPAVIFTHIPKTAGTSLRHIVQSQFQPHQVFEFYNLRTQPPKVLKGIEKYRSLSKTRQRAIEFISGHVGFGLHEYLQRPCTYITVLRDPVERVISYYYFLGRTQNEIVRDKSLAEFIKTWGGAHNSMTCYLSGLTLKAQLQEPDVDLKSLQFERTILERAKANLERYFQVVGFVDRFDETCILLKQKLGWNFSSFYVRKNVANRNYLDEVDPADLDLIYKYNELDLELYSHARGMFEKTIADLGDRFEQDLANFQLDNQSPKNRLYFHLQASYRRMAYRVYERLA